MIFNEKLGKKMSEEAVAAKSLATTISLAISAIAILIVGGLALQIRAGLGARLREANHLAAAIAKGDLSTANTPSSFSNDEAGQLIQSMEKMVVDEVEDMNGTLQSSALLKGRDKDSHQQKAKLLGQRRFLLKK